MPNGTSLIIRDGHLKFAVCMCIRKCICVSTHESLNFAENMQKYNRLYFPLQVVKCTLNPRWQKFWIPVRTLCNGDYDRSIKVLCCDWNSNGDHSHIGEFYCTLRQLSEGPSGSNVFQCVHPKKQVCVCLCMICL
jgi:hypothetical protein